MNKEEILSTITSLAKSQGLYERVLTRLHYLRDFEPEEYRDVMSELEGQRFESPVELVMYFEC